VTARAVAALTIILCTAACGGRARPELLPVPGEPGHLIEVNGHRLYFECLGTGKPTVLLEAGYGGDQRSWDAIEPELAKTTHTCEYDRFGLGLSSAEQPKRRGPFDQLEDLGDLLDGAGIDPPYIVVGHSYGGILAWFFTRRHLDSVDGLLLLDSSHPWQTKRFRAVLPKSVLAEPEQVSPENVRFSDAIDEVGEPGSIEDTRLIVMTAGQAEESDLPKQLVARLGRIWGELQGDYASRSSDSVRVIARYSGHFIQSNLGQPDLVVRAIRELVSAARADRPLRDCHRVFRPPGAACASGGS
jgi:pimeloyl-ACP methyl ester carboxylesterase